MKCRWSVPRVFFRTSPLASLTLPPSPPPAHTAARGGTKRKSVAGGEKFEYTAKRTYFNNVEVGDEVYEVGDTVYLMGPNCPKVSTNPPSARRPHEYAPGCGRLGASPEGHRRASLNRCGVCVGLNP
jgi:hypothetical protein